jgi:hypothetical protein
MATAQDGATDTPAPAEIADRDVRALTEPMLVVADHPDAWGDHEAVVYNADREYLVNVDIGYCDCPDVQYRRTRCKHLRRADFALGRRDVPDWVEVDALDDPLRKRVEGGDD